MRLGGVCTGWRGWRSLTWLDSLDVRGLVVVGEGCVKTEL